MQIKEYLNQERVDYQLWSHRPTFSSQQMASEEHVPGMNVAKPVIVQADGTFYMCVLPACCKVDLERLRAQLNCDQVRLAYEEELNDLFPDCQLGAEPPFGPLYNMTTLMDETMLQDEFIIFQAGKHDQAMRIDMNDYKELVQPKILSFSYHLH